jgi:hypothetical protein
MVQPNAAPKDNSIPYCATFRRSRLKNQKKKSSRLTLPSVNTPLEAKKTKAQAEGWDGAHRKGGKVDGCQRQRTDKKKPQKSKVRAQAQRRPLRSFACSLLCSQLCLLCSLCALSLARTLAHGLLRCVVVIIPPTTHTHTHTPTPPFVSQRIILSFIHSFFDHLVSVCVCVCVHVCLCVNNLFSFFPPFVCTPTDQPTNPTQFILLTALFSVCTEQPLSLLENTANLGIPFA